MVDVIPNSKDHNFIDAAKFPDSCQFSLGLYSERDYFSWMKFVRYLAK